MHLMKWLWHTLSWFFQQHHEELPGEIAFLKSADTDHLKALCQMLYFFPAEEMDYEAVFSLKPVFSPVLTYPVIGVLLLLTV